MSTTSTRRDVADLQQKFGDAILKIKEFQGQTFVCVKKSSLVAIAEFLRDHPDFKYTYFSECVGVDYSTWPHGRDFEERFEVVYNIISMNNYERLFLKVGCADGEKIPTLKNVWQGAEYPEREIWDLFGIEFAGNEQTQRFLLPDDWIGHPLRKEYPLGGEDVLFDQATMGPAVEDMQMPHAGESFEGKTGSDEISGR